MNNTIGIHYELPDGRIAFTYGWNGRDNTVSYYFDDDSGAHEVHQDEFNTWKPRHDLRDNRRIHNMLSLKRQLYTKENET
jgi:hypothetical protein